MTLFNRSSIARPAGKAVLASLAASAAVLIGAMALAPASAQAQVSVSVGVNQPGVYGVVEFGNAPPPPVIYQQPIVIQQPAVVIPRHPIYLRVPPGYEANWGRYCGRYAACNQPVYFVRDDPRPPPPIYRRDDRHWDHRGPDRRYDSHGDRRDYRHDDRHDDHRGPPGRDGR